MTPKQCAERLIRLVQEGVAPEKAVASLSSFLRKRKTEHLLQETYTYLERRKRNEVDPSVLYLGTAHEIETKTLEELKKKLEVPDDTRVVSKVDEKHLGGFRALYKYTLVDATLEGQLEKLRTKLLKMDITS